MLAHLATLVALAAPATGAATDITPNSAVLHGTADAPGTAFFKWGTTSAYGGGQSAVQTVPAGAVQDTATPLSPNTTYHFTIVVNGVEGGDATFKTLPNPTPPLVSDQHATAVTTSSAHFSGKINPKGATTTYYFQYGRSASYGNRTASTTVPAGDPVTVQADVSALRPYTLYHWRLFARNAAGNTPGRDHTFRTGRLATALTLFSTRPKVSYGSGITLGGRVSGSGINQMTLALQQEQFPFGTGFAQVRTTHAGKDGGYLFDVDHVWGLTRFRVVTQTQAPLTSAVVPVKVVPRTAIGVRNRGRKRARISGTLKPATTGELSLQRRLASGRWTQVKHKAIAGAKTFSFTVLRAKKVNRAFRVVVLPARGAYVKTTTRAVLVSRRPGRAKGHRAAAG